MKSLYEIRGNIIVPITSNYIDQLQSGSYTVKFNEEIGYYLQINNDTNNSIFDLPSYDSVNTISSITKFIHNKSVYIDNNIPHTYLIEVNGKHHSGKTSYITILSNKILELNGIVIHLEYINIDICNIIANISSNLTDTHLLVTIDNIDTLLHMENVAEIKHSITNLLSNTNIRNLVMVYGCVNTDLLPDILQRKSVRVNQFIDKQSISDLDREYFLKQKLATVLDKVNIKEWISNTAGKTFNEIQDICINYLIHNVDESILFKPKRKS